MAYQPKPMEIAGVDIVGERQSDGTLKLGTASTVLPDTRDAVDAFPEEVEVCGATYTLETVRKNKDDFPAVVVPGHPGYNIEWGIYV